MNQFSRELPPLEVRYRNDRWDLIFRPMDVQDLQKTHNAILDSDESLKRFMPWSHYELSAVEHAKLFMRFHAEYFLGVEYHLTCVDAKTDEFILNISILPQQRFNRHSVEIGYWTSAKYQNLGLATLAVKIITALCFECLECDRVFATTNIENRASARVLEKCGMQKEGTMTNYIPAASERMISQGYSAERKTYLFALTPQDRKRLGWYQDILLATTAKSVYGKLITLKELSL